jgi:CRP-like cAMP-binding protein
LAHAQQVGYLYVSDYFGEHALLRPHSPPAASVLSRARVTEVLCIDRAVFQRLVGPLSEILGRSEHAVAAELTTSVPLFAELTADCRARLRERLQPEAFADGASIFEHNEWGDKLHIITAGRVLIRVPDAADPTGWAELEQLGAGEVFGERALVKWEPRMASAVAVGDVKTCSLAAEDFDALQMHGRARCALQEEGELGGWFGWEGVEYVTRRKSAQNDYGSWQQSRTERQGGRGKWWGRREGKGYGQMSLRSANYLFPRWLEPYAPLPPALRWSDRWQSEDTRTTFRLRIVSRLGSGSFGTGWLVMHSGNGQRYALKAIDKARPHHKDWAQVRDV